MLLSFPPPVIPISVKAASPGPFTTHPIIERVIGAYEALGDIEQQEVLQMLKLCNMEKLLNYRISRPIGRKDNLEVWL